MGFIRGALVTITTILLFVSLLSTGIFLTISLSLNYNVIKPEVQTIVQGIILEENNVNGIDTAIVAMQLYCKQTNNTMFVHNLEGYDIEIPCDVINQGSEAVINHTVDDLVEQNYYKEYDCEFMDCFNQEGPPFFLLSKHSKDYFNHWFYICFIISILLAIGLFFFAQSKNGYPFLIGILLIVASLPFLGIGKIISMVIGWEYAEIFSAFFTQSYAIFLIYIILGIIAIGTGIVLKFLSIGRFFGKLFKKDEKVTKEDIKDSVKEVIKEENKSKKKSKK